MTVDFHCHTLESDGSLAPQALADYMRDRKVEIYAITDHDTLSAYSEFKPAAGARVVTGIEINTTWRENEVHILGFALPLDDASLNGVLARNRVERRRRVERIVMQLQQAGYRIALDDVLREAAGSKSLGRPHVAKALIRLGVVEDAEAAFRGFLRRGKPGYVPSEHITPSEAISAIRSSAGIAVLAHPGRLKDRSIIDALAAEGILHGIEVFYPTHTAEDVEYFREKARQYHLVMTAGSDFHDIRYHAHGVGVGVDRSDVEAFLELVLR